MEDAPIAKLFGVELKSHKIAKIESNTAKDDLQVIGAGLSRTGTTSLKAALEILGFDPCMHMSECANSRQKTLDYTSLLRRKWAPNRTEADKAVDLATLKSLMRGYRATVDAPGCDFYQEFMEIYPQAKVVLSVRTTDEVWWKSMEVLRTVSSTRYKYISYASRVLREQKRLHDECLQMFPEEYGVYGPQTHSLHNQRVIEVVPSERLLVFQMKDGWEPLCKFLEVPVPEEPFPNLNDSKAMQRLIFAAQAYGICVWLFYLGLGAGLTWAPFGLVKYYSA